MAEKSKQRKIIFDTQFKIVKKRIHFFFHFDRTFLWRFFRFTTPQLTEYKAVVIVPTTCSNWEDMAQAFEP